MTRKLSRSYSRSVVAAFIAILTLLIAGTMLAQGTGAPQSSRKPQEAFAAPETYRLPPALQRPLGKASGEATRTPVGQLRHQVSRAGPLDTNLPVFLPEVAYYAGNSPDSVMMADVNGDGRPDLIVSNFCRTEDCLSDGGSVTILLADGDGVFEPATTSYGSGGIYAGGAAAGDFNGDGKTDIAVANRLRSRDDSSGVIGVLFGNGDGTLQPVVTYSSGGGWPMALIAQDVNGDGHPDLISGNLNSDNLSVLLNNGDGTFQPAVTYYPGGVDPWSLVLADLNGDGHPDMVVANRCDNGYTCYSGSVGVVLGNPDGTFQLAGIYDSNGVYASGIVAGDFNRDGKLDVAVANRACNYQSGCSPDGSVTVLLGNGDGTLNPAITYDSGGEITVSLMAADLNLDGAVDLLTSHMGGDPPNLLLGNGDGTLQPAVTFSVASSTAMIANVNGDSKPDMLTVHDTYAGVMLNNTNPDNPTTTTLLSSVNPSDFSEEVTFTATVSSSSSTPTGIVIFVDGWAYVGKAPLHQGSASISLTSLSPGSHTMLAVYQGSGSFSGSASPPLNQVVNKAPTATSLVSSENPAPPNQLVTYTATVISKYGIELTGTVTFSERHTTLATVTLVGNQAAYATSYAVSGRHFITATYSGDGNSAGSQSPVLTQYIAVLPVASKTTVITSGSPSSVGQPVTFTANVTSKYGSIPDGELVTFYDGTTPLGSVALASGTAAFTTSSLSAKTHFIKATYAGDATFKPSTGWVKQVVDKYPTTTALRSSPNPSRYGQAVKFTAHVTSAGPNRPTGKVWFKDGTTGIGWVTLSGGVAKLTKSKLAVGTHPITAQYLGDAASAKSTSSVLDQVVK